MSAICSTGVPPSKLVESSDPTPLNGSALRPGRRASVLVDGLGRCGGCIEWSVSATAPGASPWHLAQAAVDIPGHACRAAHHYRSLALGPHAAPQVGRVHLICRMMRLTQLRWSENKTSAGRAAAP